MLTAETLAEVQIICPGAEEMCEAGLSYIYLPSLKLQTGDQTSTVDALLCLQARDGYVTRLFLSQQVQGRGNNWTTHRILERIWYTWSWNHVSPDQRPAQILAEHLRALK